MLLEELQPAVEAAQKRLESLRRFLSVDDRAAELARLDDAMASPDFWNDKDKAQETIAAANTIRGLLDPFRKVESQIDDLALVIELAEIGEETAEMLGEADHLCKTLDASIDRLELISFLSGRMDRNGAIYSVHAGAGGTESCDWASMLLRMHLRWCEMRGYKTEVVEISAGEEAGVKSATVLVHGEFAYGYMKSETGVHRLVRISPFDANKRRHTSFCAVAVVPQVDDDVDIEINEADLRIDTYRASGAGGQHVNRTDSAVRITHQPSGIVVACQQERSQHKNRATAMKILKARLYERAEQKRLEEQAKARGEQMENAWGSQIRSYVLQPYQMVKDLRTGVEVGNVSAVLDGDLDPFAEAFLRGEKRADR